jgi:hypothetical protein
MTSSFTLQQIDKAKGAWTYALPNSSLGGLEDSYLKITGECHPDFTAVPIGNKYGTKMCVRNVDPGVAANGCGVQRIGDRLHEKGRFEIEKAQGYRRGSVNMYDPLQRFPTQEWNPDFYSSRRTPWQGQLTLADYLQHTNVNYNGTGIKPLHTIHELNDKNTKYLEYAYAFTPLEDPDTGKRVATSFNQAVLPPKYDLTRLVQPYILSTTESEYLGIPYGNTRDTTHYERIV